MDSTASRHDLLYISSDGNGVYVYTYPRGKLVGTLDLNTFGAGECVDPSGDVFITTENLSGSSTIYEYAHGGTSPVAVLSDPGEANGCAVDPVTGNLAVTNLLDSTNPYHSNNGDLALYAGAAGNPIMYYPGPQIRGFQFCGYDDDGNLYLSASDSYKQGNDLVRLPKGSSIFKVLNLNAVLSGWSSVQWDGKHIAVSSMPTRKPISIYRLRISGDTAKVIGTAELNSTKDIYAGQIWIHRDTALGIGQYKRGYENVYLWPYPVGGQPKRTIMEAGRIKQILWGLTVSLAQPE